MSVELVFGIVTGLIILVLLVVLHELGHAIAAKRNGVVVEEFGIGFPPRAWAKKLKNGVLFSLNWLPLGGFVKLQGEHDAADEKGDYGAATFWQKTKILLAGVFINWFTAVLLITVLAWTGLPKVLPDQFTVAGDTSVVRDPIKLTAVVSDYPAETAGLQVGDVITSLADQTVTTNEQLIELTKVHKGETVKVVYERDGSAYTVDVQLKDSKEGSIFGAGLGQREVQRSTWSAPVVGVAVTGQLTWATLEGVGSLVANVAKGVVLQFSPNEQTREVAKESLSEAGDSVAGPVGILGTIFPSASQAGPTQLVLLTAIISLTLAVMNVLPIPALDGGRWFTMAIFKLLRKPLTKEREETIQTIGFLVLMALIVLITIMDVTKLFR